MTGLKIRRMPSRRYQSLMTLAIVASLVMQPLSMLWTAATASALANGPFTLDVVCEAEKAVLNLQTRQEVANWATGKVYYKTAFGKESHDLSRGDVDVWSVTTGQAQIPAGTAEARIAGLYFFGGYDKTFTINYEGINCDTTAPSAPQLSATAAGQPLVSGQNTNSYNVTASWTNGSDDAVKYEYAYWNNILGNQYKEGTPYIVSLTELQHAGAFTEGEGVHFMKVRAYDAAGNQSAWSNTFVVIYDLANPVVAINNPIDGQKVSGVVPVNLTIQDGNLEKYSYRIRKVNADNTPTGTAIVDKVIVSSSPLANQQVFAWDTTSVSEGKYFVYASAQDTTGKRSEQRIYVTVDNTKPTITVKPESKGIAPFYQMISFKLFDAGMVDKVTINGVEKQLTDNKWSDLNGVQPGVFGAVEGENTLVVYDVAGNTETFIFTLDTVAPSVPTHESPSDNAKIKVNDFWFEWNDVPTAVSYEMQNSQSPDVTGVGGSFTNVQWTGDYQKNQPSESMARSVGANGTWYWQVRAVDAAGNKSAWTSPWKVTIDRVTPTSTHDLANVVRGTVAITQTVIDNDQPASGKLRIWKLNSDGTQDDSKFFSIGDKAVDSQGRVTYTLDTVTKLYGDGEYIAKFTATDEAGNASVEHKKFVVDNSGPVVTASIGPNPVKSIDALVLNLSAADVFSDIVSAKYTLYHEGDNEPLAKNVQITGTYDAKTFVQQVSIPVPTTTGSYRIQLHVNDALGNQGKRTVYFEVDNSMNVTINPVGSSSANPTISGRASWGLDNTYVANHPVRVEIRRGGTLVTTTPLETSTDADGVWSVQAPTLANDTTYSILAVVGTEVGVGRGEATLTPVTIKVAQPDQNTGGQGDDGQDTSTGVVVTNPLPLANQIPSRQLATGFSSLVTATTPVLATATPSSDDDESEVRGLSTSSSAAEDTSDQEGEVKAAEDSKPTWSLANALLAAAAVVMGLMALLGLFGKKEEGEESMNGRRVAAVVLGAGSVVVLLFLENFSGSMSFVDLWTLGFATIAAAQIAIIATLKRA